MPPGWYPVSEFEQRYWDGRSWTDNTAPRQKAEVSQPPQPTPATKGTSTLTWVLVALGLLVVLGVGGCIAAVSVMGNDMQQQFNDISSQLSTPTP